MPFYDHYATEMTPIGYRWVKQQKNYQISLILNQHPSAITLLEIGPGAGVFADIWRDTGREYIAIDGSPKLVKQLTVRGLNVVEAMVPPLPVSNQSVDVVYASHVLEHMPHGEAAVELADEIYRCLRGGGIICLVVPDAASQGLLFWDIDYTHNYVTTKNRVSQLLSNSGFKILSVQAMSGPYQGVVAFILWNAIRFVPHRLFLSLFPQHQISQQIKNGKYTFLKQLVILAQKVDHE